MRKKPRARSKAEVDPVGERETCFAMATPPALYFLSVRNGFCQRHKEETGFEYSHNTHTHGNQDTEFLLVPQSEVVQKHPWQCG